MHLTYPRYVFDDLHLFRYSPHGLWELVGELTDSEFDPECWNQDPDLDFRDLRDVELLLDLSGNIDSCV